RGHRGRRPDVRVRRAVGGTAGWPPMTDDARQLPVRPAEIEKALRDVGLSRKQARGFMARGMAGAGLEQPDDEPHVDDALATELRRAAATLRGTQPPYKGGRILPTRSPNDHASLSDV